MLNPIPEKKNTFLTSKGDSNFIWKLTKKNEENVF